jgi:hypothetical protein
MEKLTGQLIDETPDEKLIDVVFQHLLTEGKWVDSTAFESPVQFLFILARFFEDEINNGGYLQFYDNRSCGKYWTKIPEALRLFGASELANLTEQANSFYTQWLNNRVKEGISLDAIFHDNLYQDNTKLWEHLNMIDDITLEKIEEAGLTDRFFELYKRENLEQLETQYIRSHKQDFIDK